MQTKPPFPRHVRDSFLKTPGCQSRKSCAALWNLSRIRSAHESVCHRVSITQDISISSPNLCLQYLLSMCLAYITTHSTTHKSHTRIAKNSWQGKDFFLVRMTKLKCQRYRLTILQKYLISCTSTYLSVLGHLFYRYEAFRDVALFVQEMRSFVVRSWRHRGSERGLSPGCGCPHLCKRN